MLNKEIHEALELICDEKSIGETTKKQIKDFLDKKSTASIPLSEQDTRIENILKGISNGT